MKTAINLEMVNLSLWLDGNADAKISVKRLEVEDNTVTIPASAFAKAIWNV